MTTDMVFQHYETSRVFYDLFDGMIPEDLGVDSAAWVDGRVTESEFIDILLQYAIAIVEEETVGWSKGIMMEFLGNADFTAIAAHMLHEQEYNAGQREFIKTDITPEMWDRIYGED